MSNSLGRRRIAASVVLGTTSVLLSILILAPTHAAVGIQTSSTPDGVESCQACHGTNGISANPGIPNLAGQKSGYLVAQLKAFKSEDRKNDLMESIAGQLSETDMTNLAKYWSSRPAAEVPTDKRLRRPQSIRE